MKNIKGNLFEQECDAICITTNGFVKNDGECVMGRGCAATAALTWPQLPKLIGNGIKLWGNRVFTVKETEKYAIMVFPVKPISEPFTGTNAVSHMAPRFKIGQTIPGWACKAKPGLIIKSAKELLKIANQRNWNRIVLPRPGCGAGELNWSDIEPYLQEILDDRFEAITF